MVGRLEQPFLVFQRKLLSKRYSFFSFKVSGHHLVFCLVNRLVSLIYAGQFRFTRGENSWQENPLGNADTTGFLFHFHGSLEDKCFVRLDNFSVCFLFKGDQTRAVEERFRACEKVCEPWNDEMVIKKSNTDCCFVYYISETEKV